MTFTSEIINKMKYDEAKDYLYKYPSLLRDYEFTESTFKDFVISSPNILLDDQFKWYRAKEVTKYILVDWLKAHRGSYQTYQVLNTEVYRNTFDKKTYIKILRTVVKDSMDGNKYAKSFIAHTPSLIANTTYKDFTIDQNNHIRELVYDLDESFIRCSYIKEFILSYDFVNEDYINKMNSFSINNYVNYMNEYHKNILIDNIRSEKCERFVEHIFSNSFVYVRDIVYEIIRKLKIDKFDEIIKGSMSENSLKHIDVSLVRHEDVRPDQLQSYLTNTAQNSFYINVKPLYKNYLDHLKYWLLR